MLSGVFDDWRLKIIEDWKLKIEDWGLKIIGLARWMSAAPQQLKRASLHSVCTTFEDWIFGAARAESNDERNKSRGELVRAMPWKEEFDRRSDLLELCRVVTKISEAKIEDWKLLKIENWRLNFWSSESRVKLAWTMPSRDKNQRS